ncbi:MAG: CotH kinase family protein [Bacteroidales bacterium]|nr:CotH kinase family protein [Bacteroidales bacterium]
MKRAVTQIITGIILLILLTPGSHAQIHFDFLSQYRYLKGSEASSLSGDWILPDFDDSGWISGAAPFWYGDGTGGTMLNDMQGSYSTFFLRTNFNAENTEQLKTLKFSIDYDDGFIIWINGKEALRQNVPENVSYDSYALANHESGSPAVFYVDSSEVFLVEGLNTLAVHVLNVTLSSSDIHFDLSISAIPQLPEFADSSGGILFSHDAGFFSEPFQLTMSSPVPGTGIIYTLDCSDPRTSSTSFPGDSSVVVTINPADTEGRPRTPAVIVRASIVKEGYTPSIPRTRTYIFTNEVRNQVYPGNPWPSTNLNGQVIDLIMDPNVVNDSRYSNIIENALLDIPSLSLVSDSRNLFDPSFGIYVNADNYGDEWERECSLELIDPNGEGFHVNAGMRIRGGASRSGYNPKHAFRLFFREQYGDDKLEFPLFGDEGTDEFDKIDIRTEQNYSWSKDGGSAGALNNFIKDIYSRKMQGEMGQPYTRSRYYHLYLNGMYWGLFMTEERPEARFAESYFGDDREDYDVVKVTTQSWPYYNIVTDGNMDAWEEVWNLCGKGFAANEDYFRLEGKDAGGKPVKGSKVLVDIDNLIDYMAMTFYTGNYDGPVSAWYGEDMPNNYFAIYNRKHKGTGFVFIAHDQEHSMMVDPINVDNGINENRVTIPDMSVSGLLNFHPQWLHHRLTTNNEYRLRFADRTHKYFHNNGLFTPERAKTLFNEFADQIDLAIIAESARWGDAQHEPARTKDDDWLKVINDINNRYFPARTGIVVKQMEDAGLLTTYQPPLFKQDETILSEEHIKFTGSQTLIIHNPNGDGEICYTTGGGDPRLTGGSLSTEAVCSPSDVTIPLSNTTVINARIKAGNQWSSLSRITASVDAEDYAHFKVTELHYHPPDLIQGEDTISGKDREFIEFKNTGEHAVDISGLVLDSAVWYQVPEETVVTPGQFFVLASKPEIFYDQYGLNPSGNYRKNFSNAGEYLLLTDASGNEIFSFTYLDDPPWPILADGGGYSLTSTETDPAGDPSDYSYWRISHYKNGSPFADDVILKTEEPSINEGNFRIFPNPATHYFIVENNSDETAEIIIFNNSGRPVYSGSFRDLTTIQSREIGGSGLYFIKLSTRRMSVTLKILVL